MVVTAAWILPAEKVKSAQQANVDAHQEKNWTKVLNM